MIERDAVFITSRALVLEFVEIVSVFKFGKVLPLVEVSSGCVRFVGVDDYVLHYFHYWDERLVEKLRGHRFDNMFFNNYDRYDIGKVDELRWLCSHITNIRPDAQLEKIHEKILEMPELIETYLWWADLEWRENAV